MLFGNEKNMHNEKYLNLFVLTTRLFFSPAYITFKQHMLTQSALTIGTVTFQVSTPKNPVSKCMNSWKVCLVVLTNYYGKQKSQCSHLHKLPLEIKKISVSVLVLPILILIFIGYWINAQICSITQHCCMLTDTFAGL